jgi:N-acetylmuramoyl-L-alanine amidase
MLKVLPILLFVFLCQESVCASEIRGVRVWTGPEKTRAVLDLNSTAEYRLFQLQNPERVVIDLENSHLSGAVLLDQRHSGVIAQVRHARQNSGSLRMVFDLSGKASARSFLLEPAGEYGHRLVLDLFPTAQEETKGSVKSASDYQREADREVIIAIDAGHGGEDPGASGPRKTREKNVVFELARELQRQINAEPGMRAVLTRKGDYYLAHRKRFELARESRADLFLSLHADAFNNPKVYGGSVYVLSRKGASSEAARWIADKENEADLIGGVSLDDKDDVLASVLLDLSQAATMESSNHVASTILENMKLVGKTHKKKVEHANFLVLKSPDVPSVLVETAFISNPDDERRLRDKSYQRKLASAITRGIHEHFTAMPLPGTWYAATARNHRHTIARGDTLSEIAERYQVSINSLRRTNQINGNTIKVGQELIIPAS